MVELFLMFLSRLPPNKRAPKIWGLFDKVPGEIREVLKSAKILYRGVVSNDGSFGDVLIRTPDNRLLNVVWDEDYGEVRELDRSFIRKLITAYDSTVQQYSIHHPQGSLDDLFILNDRMTFKTSKVKKIKNSFEPL